MHHGGESGRLLGIQRSSDSYSRDVMCVLPQGTFGTRRHFRMSRAGQDLLAPPADNFPFHLRVLLPQRWKHVTRPLNSGSWKLPNPTLFYTFTVLFKVLFFSGSVL